MESGSKSGGSKSDGSKSDGLENDGALSVEVFTTKWFPCAIYHDQIPDAEGLTKPISTWSQVHYAEGFISSALTVYDVDEGDSILIAVDGEESDFTETVLDKAIRLVVANAVSKIQLGLVLSAAGDWFRIQPVSKTGQVLISNERATEFRNLVRGKKTSLYYIALGDTSEIDTSIAGDHKLICGPCTTVVTVESL